MRGSVSILLGIEQVVVTWAVQYVYHWLRAFRKVVMVDFASFSSVHVLHSHWDTQGCCQCSDVHVVTLLIHGLYFLQRKERRGWGRTR